MFKNPVLVSSVEDITIPVVNDFLFAKDITLLPLASKEIKEACKHYPIFFIKEKDGGIVPVALLGLEDKNLFINEKGEYKKDTYIPALLRAYPFSVTKTGEAYSLVIDKDATKRYPGIKKFFSDGEISKEGKNIVEFVEALYGDLEQTKMALAPLAKKSLLKPMDIEIKTKDRAYKIQNALIADKEAIESLPDKEIAKLYRDGICDITALHLLSLSNLERLGRLKDS
jgi:hypothetical protein